MTQPSSNALHTSALTSLPLLARGKVRDNYAVGDDRILMVASDRLSAFDVIMGEPIPVEAVVRGYLAGSGWKEYQESRAVCGVPLPEGLTNAAKLPEPIYTPAAKAAAGEHDENITFERTVEMIGLQLATRIRDLSIAIYKAAADIALAKGMIIADTKFEFGLARCRQQPCRSQCSGRGC